MKLNTRHIGNTFYTEYTAKAGETLRQIAIDQLRNEGLASTILRMNNNVPDLNAINAAQNITGWILLLPPVPANFLAAHPAANKKLAELKDQADKGTLSAEDYYAQRKLILSVL